MRRPRRLLNLWLNLLRLNLLRFNPLPSLLRLRLRA
jgi:hypothetical protein